MGITEDIQQRLRQGKPDAEIINEMQSKGVSPSQAKELISQAKIKSAVNASSASEDTTKSIVSPESMSPSVMGNDSETAQNSAVAQPPQEQAPQPGAPQMYEQAPPGYPAQSYGQPVEQQYEYPQEQAYAPQYNQMGTSTDALAELADQIILEKLAPLQTKLEETLAFKNVVDAKMEYLDERLKRLEKTIDRLQLSVLQKVGEYITNVEDIRNEMIETQKTFNAVTNKKAV